MSETGAKRFWIPELHLPGNWLSDDYGDTKHDLQSMVRLMQSGLAAAAVSLSDYAASTTSIRAMEGSGARSAAILHRAQAIEAELGGNSLQLTWQERVDLSYEASVRARREAWAAGWVPEEFEDERAFVYATSFVWALIKVRGALRVAAKIDPAAMVAEKAFASAFPDLAELRDTLAHLEARVRSLATQKETPFTSAPVALPSISLPFSGAIIAPSLMNHRLTATGASGLVVQVEISPTSLAVATGAVQTCVSALRWNKSPFKEHWPAH